MHHTRVCMCLAFLLCPGFNALTALGSGCRSQGCLWTWPMHSLYLVSLAHCCVWEIYPHNCVFQSSYNYFKICNMWMNVYFLKVQKNNGKSKCSVIISQSFWEGTTVCSCSLLDHFPVHVNIKYTCAHVKLPCSFNKRDHCACCAPCVHAHMHTLMYTNRLQCTCCLPCICAHMHTLVCLEDFSLWCYLWTSFLCDTRVQVDISLLTNVPAVSCPLLRLPGFFYNCGVHSWCFEQLTTLSWLIHRWGG